MPNWHYGYHKRDASDDHDPIYDLIAKRNPFHGMIVYQKREDSDRGNDLMQEWLRKVNEQQKFLNHLYFL